MSNTKKMPGMCFHQTVGEFLFKATEGGGGTISLVALSGEPISRFFGDIIQDLSGMSVQGDSIAIDYCHDEGEIMGVIDEFSTSGGKLTLKGKLTPFGEGDRASEVMAKMTAGVPYQASIDFRPRRPGQLKIEEVEAGDTAQVNGKEVQGPITIVREWPLTGVAICPHGADAGTSASLQNSDQQEVEVDIMDPKDEKKTQTPDAPVVTQDDVTAAADAATKGVHGLFAQFVEKFGNERAADYFTSGLTMEDALQKFATDVQADNDAKDAEIALLKTTKAAEPVVPGTQGAEHEDDSDAEVAGNAAQLPEGLAEESVETYAQSVGLTRDEAIERLTGDVALKHPR
jgi:hypothetical protein